MTDTIIMTYGESPANNTLPMKSHIKFSIDYGATWTDEDKFTDGSSITQFPLLDVGQARPIVAPNGDIIVLAWGDINFSGNGTWQTRSTDGGKTWSEPAMISISGISDADNLITFAVDQAFVVESTIYVSCIHYSYLDWETYPATYYDILIKSIDNGISWSYVGKISNVPSGEAGITRIGTTKLISIVRGLENQVYKTTSDDMGVTWSDCELMSTFGTGGRFHLWTKAQLKGETDWWLDPVLIMTGFLDNIGRQNSVWISKDAGTTWSDAFALDTPAIGNDGGYGDAFWNMNTGEYVFVNYKGTPDTADVKQYNCTIGGI